MSRTALVTAEGGAAGRGSGLPRACLTTAASRSPQASPAPQHRQQRTREGVQHVPARALLQCKGQACGGQQATGQQAQRVPVLVLSRPGGAAKQRARGLRGRGSGGRGSEEALSAGCGWNAVARVGRASAGRGRPLLCTRSTSVPTPSRPTSYQLGCHDAGQRCQAQRQRQQGVRLGVGERVSLGGGGAAAAAARRASRRRSQARASGVAPGRRRRMVMQVEV